MNRTELMKAYAVMLTERHGLSVLPIGEDKRPAIKWMDLQERKPTFEEILCWPDFTNLAVITGQVSNLVIVDCDSKEDGKWFWDNVAQSPTVVRSKRGFHYYFKHPGEKVQNAVKVSGKYDVRGDGGYALLPPSIHSEGGYEWVKPLVTVDELPVFLPEWRPVMQASRYARSDSEIRDAVAYIAKIKAISGSGGHNDTYRAACTLKSAGLSEAEALLALQDWNQTNADPPWSNRELLHKIQSAYSCSDFPS